MLNVFSVADALIHEDSDISLNSITGRVSRIFSYSFDESKFKERHIFIISETSGLEVFVDECFKKIVEKNDLKGLILKSVYPSIEYF